MAQVKNLDPEEDFRQRLLSELPPVIARSYVQKLLGGLVAPQTLANADSSGNGPIGAYQCGHKILYPREALVDWIIKNFGISYCKSNVKELI